MPSCQALVFDLFHTLIDPERFRPRSFHRVQATAELLGLDGEHFAEFWRERHKALNRDSRLTVKHELRRYLLAQGKEVEEAKLLQADELMGRYQEMALLQVEPKVVEVVAALHQHFRLGLLSDAHEREIRNWDRSPLQPHFDVACFSCKIGFAKPDERAFAAVLDRLGVEANEAVYIGDGGSQEFQGARSIGFQSIVFLRAYVSSNGLRTPEQLDALEAQADIVLDDHRDLLSFFGV